MPASRPASYLALPSSNKPHQDHLAKAGHNLFAAMFFLLGLAHCTLDTFIEWAYKVRRREKEERTRSAYLRP